MLVRVSRFVESLVDQYGMWKVVSVPFALVPVLAAFGVIGSDRAASVIAATTFVLVSLIVIIALSGQLRRERHARLRRSRIITRLSDTIMDQAATGYTWEKWIQRESIGAGGDTVIEQWRTLRVNVNSTVRVIWAAQEKTTGEYTRQQRRAATVDAYEFFERSTAERDDGVRYDSAEIWREHGQVLMVFVYLEEPLTAGQRLHVHFIWNLPGYYRELIDGGTDTMLFMRKAGSIEAVDCEMVFRPSAGLRRKLKLHPRIGTDMPTQYQGADGSIRITASYGPSSLPEEAGFRLDNSSEP